MNVGYYIFLSLVIVPYLSASLLGVLRRDSNASYMPLIQSLTWLAIFIPVTMPYFLRVLLLLIDVLAANLLLVVVTDALSSPGMPYRITARTFMNLRTGVIVCTGVSALAYLLVFSDIFSEPAEDHGYDENLDVRANTSFQALSSTAIESFTSVLAIATGVVGVVTCAIYRYAVGTCMCGMYDDYVAVIMVVLAFAASVTVRFVPQPWGLVAHRVIVQTIFLLCMLARRPPPRKFYRPLRKHTTGWGPSLQREENMGRDQWEFMRYAPVREWNY